MELRLERFTSDNDATVGALFVDGRFQCFTLEDEYRIDKLPGETRIPAGAYPVRLRKAGGMHPKYKARYGDDHQGMLWLQNVPNFDWVYLHVGNTDKHTEGCILVGSGVLAAAGNMALQASGDAYRALCRMVNAAAAANQLTITIVDRDR